LHESCGVFGVYAPNEDVARLTFFALFALQHRGQESSGIATTDGKRLQVYAKMGLAAQVFNEDSLSRLTGDIAIGHNRYSTKGSSRIANVQPLVVGNGTKAMAIAHNGNIVNTEHLHEELVDQGYDFHSSTDTEVIANLIISSPEKDWVEKIRYAMRRLQGAYSLTIMTKDRLFGVRDPLGVRPLCLGKMNGGWVLASESCALDHIGADFIREVEPGEIVSISANGIESYEGEAGRRALCIFEYIYFARPDSTINGRLLYSARLAMGEGLAEEYPVEADLVMGVPDSATAAGVGYALRSGIPLLEGLIKNRYVGRTFIEPHQRIRDLGVKLKFNPLPQVLDGKRVVLVDDSIVRGATTPQVIKLLRKAGAKEVHMRICAPPLRYPCFFGVDMATRWELIAAQKTIPEVRDIIDFTKLDRAFNPRCVVVVGDSGQTNFQWLRGQSAFKGKLYSVQVNPETIEGIKALGVANYTSLLDIPEPVDLAIVAVPRAVAPRILEDCIAKEVAAAHFFTSGFAETNTEEGIRLERSLTERAEAANFHLIGPNCMGIFNPKVGIKQNEVQYSGLNGPVGFISQSGTHAIIFSLEAHLQGVDINKSVSFGNGIVLDSADYLAYFGPDPEIKVIGMYLEGVKDGRRFLKMLREVSARKPVVIWKGGRTEEGGRAIASHTGSLVVSQAIWEVAVRQCGAIPVARMEELIDTIKALLYLSPVLGDRVAVAGGSGGQSVAIADVFAEAGLRLPLLTQVSYDELATFFSLIGGGYRNPIDTGNQNRNELRRIFEILERDANIDNLVLMINLRFETLEQIQSNIDIISDIRRISIKPVMAIVPFSSPEEMRRTREISKKLLEQDIPTFPSMERGACALKDALDYYRLKKSSAGSL